MPPPDPLAPLIAFVVHSFLGTLLPLAVFLALLAALAAGLKPHLKGAAGERAVARRLARLGFPCLHDVILPAPDGTLTQIDHVVLTAQGPLAIETKTYAGHIFGREREREWTQALGGRKTRFQNPLRQNFKHVAALRHHLRTEVQGLVVFAGTARFPKGLPPGVATLGDLAGHMERLGRPLPFLLGGPTWQTACRLAEQGRGMRQAHLAGLRARHAPAPGLPAGSGAAGLGAVTEAALRRWGSILSRGSVGGAPRWPPAPPPPPGRW